MLLLRPFVAALAALCLLAPQASAKILIEIDKTAQRMIVSQDGMQLHVWPVSTGTRGYETPSGQYTPFRMEKDHFSREWDDAPMPHSIFFTARGHAIHGTEHVRRIGQPASHGCVRLEPENARALFALVKQEGTANVRVVLFGQTGPGSPGIARRGPRDPFEDEYTYTVRPRGVEPQPGYYGNPWMAQPDPYERRLRPPPFFGGPVRPY
jgi:hypothetical protein